MSCYAVGVEDFFPIQCPFCGDQFEIAVDTTIDSQCFTTDCENCCRPFEVTAEFSGGELVSLATQAN